MRALYKNEIRWILNLIRKEQELNKTLLTGSNTQYTPLLQLEYDNYESLKKLLHEILDTNTKRVSIK